ncbi:uncharacterized protein LOC111351405 isoform X2 [Spodoptera litura]|uniref:Uncharacterized protein LOC111351405 isoform X2 n=1 Tax=Spodoptera litura TaxID=69820 RepID=A0A9J7DYT7_SPOLT|nr:uncharacterized protein LOC111351405 isoform X2 [Spodoptera litura]
MALVFRKAVLPKNVSLLKCFKGRPLATAANKKNHAALSAAVPCRSLKDKNTTLRMGTMKIETTKQLPLIHDDCGRRVSALLRFCMSCPHLAPACRARFCVPPVCCNPSRTRSIRHDLLTPPARRAGSTPFLAPCQYLHTTEKSEFAKACPAPPCGPCPCPFPCGPCGCPNGCNCLPPPCNGPPKCIQYMTGYYYYPYGFWFCGPYHVTGQCTPVGPCAACPSPCGPPCGPPCPCPPCPCPPSCPCPPCPKCPCPRCPCPKCCACLSPVGLMDSPEPQQPQRRQAPCAAPSRPIRPRISVKHPVQQQDMRFSSTLPAPLESAAKPQQRPRSKGISKLFPFTTVPGVGAAQGLSHTSVLLCPFTTVQCADLPETSEVSKHFPVYYTPYLKQSKSNFNSRLNFNCQKPKKSTPTALSKSYSDYYEKRNEIRSPIYHKRSKKLNYEVCPLLESPRVLVSPEERDRPTVYPGAFQYTNIPNFKRPFPYTRTGAGFRPCE